NVARQFGEGLPSFPADPERLIQAFMALMLNAMDAMNTRGVLTVRSGMNPDRDDELLIEFIDTGSGIAPEELSKIFEPFFTTSPPTEKRGCGSPPAATTTCSCWTCDSPNSTAATSCGRCATVARPFRSSC